MLPCTDKSKLIHNLEKLASTVETNQHTKTLASNEQNDPLDDPISKITIVDGMVLVQKMTKNKKEHSAQ